jgi:hypothetical protein
MLKASQQQAAEVVSDAASKSNIKPKRRRTEAPRAEDLANAWAYVRSHREEIDAQIRGHESACTTDEPTRV